MEIVRTEFRNVDGSVRGGFTGHGESLNDVENFQMPMDRARGRGGSSWGVVEGMEVSVGIGEPGVTVSPGSALDSDGNLVVLAVQGSAVVDPTVDPTNDDNIPTVVVGDDGVTVPSTTVTGECVVVVTWREVAGDANAFVRRHAPWLRVLAAADVSEGEQVPLGTVTVDDAGNVLGLTPGTRRQVGVTAGRLELRSSRQTSANGALRQEQIAALTALGDGLELSVLSASGERQALHVDRRTAEVTVPTSLRIADAAGSAGGFTMRSGTDGAWRLADATAGEDRLVVDGPGRLGIGLAPGASAQRLLHVEGSEIHAGGSSGGLSFGDRSATGFVDAPTAGERWSWYADRGQARLWSGADKLWVDKDSNVGIGTPAGAPIKRTVYVSGSGSGVHIEGSGAGFSFADRLRPLGYVDNPGAGERWVWYASGGVARLWSGIDQLTVGAPDDGGGLDVPRRMRVRQGGSSSAGMWLFQTGPQADRAFVGMADDTHVGFWGSGFGWGTWMDTNTGFVSFRNDLGLADGPIGLRLWGSEIADRGGGTLTIRSGGGVVAFDGTVFFRDVVVRGRLVKPGGLFVIDHPLDPLGSTLEHSFVESPERLNVYAGTVVTDSAGEATIELPSYFEALNRDPRVQLTPIGSLARVAARLPIKDNGVEIVSDEPGLEVAWQVTGVRQDAWAERNPVVVERPKPEAERGTYLHPEVHGQP